MGDYLISFDDTDNLETLGTGHVLARFLETLPFETGYITRHQLFVDERVPFTSHNSAMCATVADDIEAGDLAERAGRFLGQEHAPGADPGLCVADMRIMADVGLLLEWGRRAKTEVLAKTDAYDLARRCNVHLSEHGGDGQGVVGALAAVGLRLSGDDGRVRGKVLVDAERMTVAELLARTGFERVCAYGQGVLANDCEIELGGNEVKAVYQDFSSTVLAVPTGRGGWRLMGKQHLRQF